MIYYRPDGRTSPFPDHRELDRGTLRSLIKGAAMTVDEFVALL